MRLVKNSRILKLIRTPSWAPRFGARRRLHPTIRGIIMRTFHVAVAFCMMLMVTPLGFGQGGEAGSLEQIRSEFQKAAAGVESLFATMHGSGVLTQESSIGTSRHATTTAAVEFARKPGMFKIISRDRVLTSQGATSPLPDVAACYNESTGFQLEKQLDSQLFVIKSTDEPDSMRKTMVASPVGIFLDCPYTLTGPSISDYLSKPEFTVVRIEPLTRDGKELLKIYFKYDSTNPRRTSVKAAARDPRPRSPLESGWLLVSPKENWVLHQAEARLTPSGDTAGVHLFSVEYEGNHSGTPVPRRAEFKTVVRILNDKKEMKLRDGTIVHDGDVASINTFKFDNVGFDAVPDREFTLPAFGLPDLSNPNQIVRRDNSFIWMFLVALLALGLAVGLKYYASRAGAPGRAESQA